MLILLDTKPLSSSPPANTLRLKTARSNSAGGGALSDNVTAHRLQGAARPRLLELAREAIRWRHYSYRTEETYLHWRRRFILFSDRRHPRDLGAAEVTAFLNPLARERHVAAATQNRALAALLFLYKEVLAQPLPWLEGVEHAKRP